MVCLDYTVTGNVKNTMAGTYQLINVTLLPCNLAWFCRRYNRRFKLQDTLPRIVCTAVRDQPMLAKLMRISEDHG